MGIWQFKSELEDTAFLYLYPQEYRRLNRRLRQHQTKYQETLDKSQEILRHTLNSDKTLREQAANVQVCGRTKEIYSLWYKMESREEHNLDHIVDVVALRVIITPKMGTKGFGCVIMSLVWFSICQASNLYQQALKITFRFKAERLPVIAYKPNAQRPNYRSSNPNSGYAPSSGIWHG
jgi:hypothetical protein